MSFALGENAEDRVWFTEFIVSEMRVLNDKLPVRTFVESEAQPGRGRNWSFCARRRKKDEMTH